MEKLHCFIMTNRAGYSQLFAACCPSKSFLVHPRIHYPNCIVPLWSLLVPRVCSFITVHTCILAVLPFTLFLCPGSTAVSLAANLVGEQLGSKTLLLVVPISVKNIKKLKKILHRTPCGMP